uniref:Uncharacterized protein n=1 Tax=Mustela putorius furo TaxID=9669 RepID=M3YJV0_MUSPF
MASGRLIKLLIFELLEFVAFVTPTLVIVEQFATAYQKKAGSPGKTHYWLIVSCSIAYVASVTLLVWVPVKVLLYKKHRLYKKIKGWKHEEHFISECWDSSTSPAGVLVLRCFSPPSPSFTVSVHRIKISFKNVFCVHLLMDI